MKYVYNWISLSFIYKCNNQTKNSFKIAHISSNSTKSCKKVKKIISDFNLYIIFSIFLSVLMSLLNDNLDIKPDNSLSHY
jgi:hypothetical protein